MNMYGNAMSELKPWESYTKCEQVGEIRRKTDSLNKEKYYVNNIN